MRVVSCAEFACVVAVTSGAMLFSPLSVELTDPARPADGIWLTIFTSLSRLTLTGHYKVDCRVGLALASSGNCPRTQGRDLNK
jgi:hypothetical protein